MDTEYLTVGEAAEKLRVTTETIYRMVERGDLAALRIGRLIRIPAAAVEMDGNKIIHRPRPEGEQSPPGRFTHQTDEGTQP